MFILPRTRRLSQRPIGLRSWRASVVLRLVVQELFEEGIYLMAIEKQA
jgi:hypothetical protein